MGPGGQSLGPPAPGLEALGVCPREPGRQWAVQLHSMLLGSMATRAWRKPHRCPTGGGCEELQSSGHGKSSLCPPAACRLTGIRCASKDQYQQHKCVPVQWGTPQRGHGRGTLAAQGEGYGLGSDTQPTHLTQPSVSSWVKGRIVGICQENAPEVLTTDQGPVGAARLLRELSKP